MLGTTLWMSASTRVSALLARPSIAASTVRLSTLTVTEWGVPRSQIRAMPYQEVVRRVVDHHRAQGELVDFWLMKGGAIVGCYRVRPDASTPWLDLLPTGTSGERYQQVVKGLGEILYPGEAVTLRAIERTNGEVTLTHLEAE